MTRYLLICVMSLVGCTPQRFVAGDCVQTPAGIRKIVEVGRYSYNTVDLLGRGSTWTFDSLKGSQIDCYGDFK